MPCTGASIDEAHKRADAFLEKIWEEMKKKEYVNCLPQTKTDVYMKGSKTEVEWKEDLKKTLRAIFWDSDANGW